MYGRGRLTDGVQPYRVRKSALRRAWHSYIVVRSVMARSLVLMGLMLRVTVLLYASVTVCASDSRDATNNCKQHVGRVSHKQSMF